MSTPAEKAAAYLTRLEADRRDAIAVSEAKAEEAKLIKARREGVFGNGTELVAIGLAFGFAAGLLEVSGAAGGGAETCAAALAVNIRRVASKRIGRFISAAIPAQLWLFRTQPPVGAPVQPPSVPSPRRVDRPR